MSFKLKKKKNMRKLLLIIFLATSTNLIAQQMGFQVVYIDAEENSQDNITDILDEFYKNNKLKLMAQ